MDMIGVKMLAGFLFSLILAYGGYKNIKRAKTLKSYEQYLFPIICLIAAVLFLGQFVWSLS